MTKRQALNTASPVLKGLKALFQEHQEQRAQAVPQTMADLERCLQDEGNRWRNNHQQEQRNGVVKTTHPTPRAVADILESKLHYGIIADNDDEMEQGQVSFYDLDTGTYWNSQRILKKLAVCVDRSLTRRQQDETLNYLFLDSQRLTETRSKWLIPVKNGVYNQHTGQLEPFTPNYVFRHKIMTNYNPQANEPTFYGWSLSSWFKQLADGDQDKLTLLWQTLSAVINPNLTTDVAIFLVDNGEVRTGKSTFERLLEDLVGSGNYGALKLKEFENDFKLASATDKALLIGDDNNPNDYNRTSENFKSVATGENVLINPKGARPFNYRFSNFIIQSMNGFPRFSDTSDALFRRIRVIVFNHQYKATAANKRIKDEYIKDPRLLEFALKRALTMTPDVLQDTAESRRFIKDIKADNDSVKYFVEHYLSLLKSTRLPVSFLFKLFLAAMDYENNPQSMKQATFTRRIKPIMNQRGWTYERLNLAPLNYWNEQDMKVLDRLDPHYQFSVDIDTQQCRPLFEKTGH